MLRNVGIVYMNSLLNVNWKELIKNVTVENGDGRIAMICSLKVDECHVGIVISFEIWMKAIRVIWMHADKR